jgi:uncharacterized protein
MNRQTLIKRTEEFVKASVHGYDSGHDWLHTDRVRRLSLYLNAVENKCEPFGIEIAALLHDVADSKFAGDRYHEKTESVIRFLSENSMEELVGLVLNVIRNISFSSKNNKPEVIIPELQIIQDADRLDAIGAIGIARAFNYGGFRNNLIWDPENISPSTIGHFYDKLLKLKDLMNTQTGKQLAMERHNFLKIFLKQFYSEWNCCKAGN